MTPLAFELLRDLSKSRFAYDSGLGATQAGAHLVWGTGPDFHQAVHYSKFFDLGEVTPLCFDVSKKMADAYSEHDQFSSRLAFLPATQTWLEFEQHNSSDTWRDAIVLTAPADRCDDSAQLWFLTRRAKDGLWRMVKRGALPLVNSGRRPALRSAAIEPDGTIHKTGPHADSIDFLAYAALALINTPRIIGRRQHMPHERIERAKLKALGLVGKFPLRAWTEIILQVALPDDRSGEPSTEAHLTGEKCLHYCRTHLRVRLGQLEYVDGHYRGNPALGFKRSRYRLEESQQGKAP